MSGTSFLGIALITLAGRWGIYYCCVGRHFGCAFAAEVIALPRQGAHHWQSMVWEKRATLVGGPLWLSL